MKPFRPKKIYFRKDYENEVNFLKNTGFSRVHSKDFSSKGISRNEDWARIRWKSDEGKSEGIGIAREKGHKGNREL